MHDGFLRVASKPYNLFPYVLTNAEEEIAFAKKLTIDMAAAAVCTRRHIIASKGNDQLSADKPCSLQKQTQISEATELTVNDVIGSSIEKRCNGAKDSQGQCAPAKLDDVERPQYGGGVSMRSCEQKTDSFREPCELARRGRRDIQIPGSPHEFERLNLAVADRFFTGPLSENLNLMPSLQKACHLP
jgi:hypothetical protein